MPTHITKRKPLVARRPAESTAVAAAIGLLIAKLAGVDDPSVITAIGVVVGFIPTAVTYVVNQVRGR